MSELEGQLRDAVKAIQWEKAEKVANELKEHAEKATREALSSRLSPLRTRSDHLARALGVLPPEVESAAKSAEEALKEGKFREAAEGEQTWERELKKSEEGLTRATRERVREVVAWAGEGSRLEEVEKKLEPCFQALSEGDAKTAGPCFEKNLAAALPEGPKKLQQKAQEVQGLVKLAKELEIDAPGLSKALEAARDATILSMDRAAAAIEEAKHSTERELRDRSLQRVKELRAFSETLKEEGAEFSEGAATLEEVLSQLPKAQLEDLKGLVTKATEAVEGPAMSVVAAYIDEVRPRLVEARQLGRNALPAIEEVNKARDAYRKKDFRTAVASAQRALEMVSELVADMEAGHEEVSEFKHLLTRLGTGGLSSPAYDQFVERAEAALRHNELDKMRSELQEGLRVVGRESLPFFRGQLDSCRRVISMVEDRGWSVPELPEKLKSVRANFQEGRFAETAEALSNFRALLRSTVAPHLSQRLEELGKALEEIQDPDSVAGVRRLMAETDIALKVKEDVEQALDKLAQTEKELAVTFAARASSLVDELDEEVRGLGDMGLETSNLRREIQQIHQIFDMGDFVKASRASRELKARLLQQQLLRAEAEVSKAKFSLVELAKMGLEPADLRAGLVDATERVRSGRYPGAYARASQVRGDVERIKTTAQKVREEIGSLAEIVSGLRKGGVGQEELQPILPRAKQASEAYQAMDFDKALTLVSDLKTSLRAVAQRREALKTLAELDALLASSRQVLASEAGWEKDLREAQSKVASGESAEGLEALKTLRPRIVDGVRSGLDAQLKMLEADLRSARSAGLDTSQVEGPLSEARRKLSEPIPTGVAELIDRSRREFFQGRAYLEQAQKSVALAREAVNQGELVRADVTDLKPRLAEMEGRFAAGESSVALELAQRLHAEATERVRTQVTKTLASFQAMINRAKMEGAITAVAENLLVQARNLLIAGKPLEALRLATRSETELERVELQHSLATNALITLKAKLDDARDQGVKAPDAEREVARAEDMMARGDYATVLERTMDGGDFLLRASEQLRRAKEAVEGTSKLLATLSGVEADLSVPKNDLDQARALLAEGKYSESQTLARTAGETARGVVEALIAQRMTDVKGRFAAVQSLDATAAQNFAPLVSRADESLKVRDWKGALDGLSAAKTKLEEGLASLLSGEQEKLKGLWKEVPPVDEADAAARAKVTDELRAARDKADYARFRELLDQAVKDAQSLRRKHLEREVADMESRVLLGERLGVDMTPVMESFSEVKMNLKSGPIEPMMVQLAKCEESLSKLLGTRLTDRSTELAGETAFARDGLSMEVAPVERMLREVETLQGSGDVVGAARRLVEAETELAKRKELHWQLTNTQYMIDQKLATLTDRKVDVGAVRDLLGEALKARQTDYAKALELSQKALDELRKLLNEGSPAGSSSSGREKATSS
ncbi:MAG: hypothetical protein KGJ23_04855 [Euryarchaeota archaeon]|nr:hypothetical protein [Euryarchaeota archaeon]MDE1835928.1 hypothetical protein [Euryarchaeota archaeon]MDE1880600.1 hypothetical protein [Euryarchaeota archaeon]MDE2044394.1 hypothetical protein [Thermoplasmata archaeon]